MRRDRTVCQCLTDVAVESLAEYSAVVAMWIWGVSCVGGMDKSFVHSACPQVLSLLCAAIQAAAVARWAGRRVGRERWTLGSFQQALDVQVLYHLTGVPRATCQLGGIRRGHSAEKFTPSSVRWKHRPSRGVAAMFQGVNGFGGGGAKVSSGFGQWYNDMQDAKEVRLELLLKSLYAKYIIARPFCPAQQWRSIG